MGKKKKKRVPDSEDGDLYFKKTLNYRHGDQTFKFKVAQDLFSSFQVDAGTRFLLRTLDHTDVPFFKILDLGCGYGPLGLVLRKTEKGQLVHMVDRDALAVDYTKQNAALNKITGIETYGSLAYHNINDYDFDLIVSNIPAKAGELVHRSMLLDAESHLKPQGLVAIVVVAPLESKISEILDEAQNVNIVFQESKPEYTVFHYQFDPAKNENHNSQEDTLQRGVFHRLDINMSFQDIKYNAKTALNLSEFDSLSFLTQLLLETLFETKKAYAKTALVFHPGQGHLPVVLSKLVQLDQITLVDRDLLALAYSRLNLLLNEYPSEDVSLSHQVGIKLREEKMFDLVIGFLRKEEGSAAAAKTIQQASEQLSPDGAIVVGSTSTVITRLSKEIEAGKSLVINKRKREKGNSVIVLGHR